MSRLTDLVRAAKQLDPQLGADLEDELKPLQRRLPFGLNFERHAPEAVELAGHKIRKTSKVRVLPPRGSTVRGDKRLWRVEEISGEMAKISLLEAAESQSATVPLADLVLVAEFRDRIYPGLRLDDTVVRGGNKPFHTVINGENFHVLEQLTFTHEHAVDAIYIDPPYNTGSRDWKYNNDYVEGDDIYRHSKWLAFMERRLKIAKRLLKPDDSVLIVTIDEKEYLRLGLLLEQTFPEARIQMVSSVINPTGAIRANEFTRINEFVFFVMLGRAEISPDVKASEASEPVRWNSLRRFEASSRRGSRPAQFYAVFVDSATHRIAGVSEALTDDVPRDTVTPPRGHVALFPLKPDGTEMIWGLTGPALMKRVQSGFAKANPTKDASYSVYYLTSGKIDDIQSGEITVVDHEADGSAIVERQQGTKTVMPLSQWANASHSAQAFGTKLNGRIMPDRQFPFPKSIYAVEDCLRYFVRKKTSAVVLDFFSGSGTTAHAVMRLNKQDGGRRQCISVTNNEVSADEQTRLRKDGLRPGDPDWEKWGICDYITKPRIRASITGRTPNDDPIAGNYKFVDEFPLADGFQENAAFFTLTYESPWMVSTDRAFAAIAPLLWLRAGAVGERIASLENGWAVAESYGILRDLDLASEFVATMIKRDGARLAYIVTDDEGRYQQVANELPGVETVRLYEDYLRNCESTGDF